MFTKQSISQCTKEGCANYEPGICEETPIKTFCLYFKSPNEQKPQETPLVAPETIKTPEMYQGGEIEHNPLKPPQNAKNAYGECLKLVVDLKKEINTLIDHTFDVLDKKGKQ